jgi:hypothetical protein
VNFELEKIWQALESKCGTDSTSQRIYRRVDLLKENGLRISLQLPNKIREVLIEVGKNDEDLDIDIDFPKWRGVQLKKINLSVPSENSIHISISLKNSDLYDVFTTVCNDLCESLCDCSSAAQRKEELLLFLYRWDRFFKSQEPEGLSQSIQQGLFGEIWWLYKMIQYDIEPAKALKAWKGCLRDYHDFEMSGCVVEVKTTRSKEPRKVWINNERQLDNAGLNALYLFVLSLHIIDDGTLTLPQLIYKVRNAVSASPGTCQLFDRNLIMAGYLDLHAAKYTVGYIIRSEELFLVSENFPCITRMPPGTGDLKYSLLVSACRDFQVSKDKYFNMARGQ